jgi:hypothetical protein
MKCGSCGASYTKSGLHRLSCAAARDRATCTNHLTVRINEVEAAILAGLKERLMEPVLFEEFAREFTAEVNRQRSALARETGTLQVELTRVAKQIDKLVEAITEGADALAINAKLKALEGQKVALEDKLLAAATSSGAGSYLPTQGRKVGGLYPAARYRPGSLRAHSWLDRRGNPHAGGGQARDRTPRGSGGDIGSLPGGKIKALLKRDGAANQDGCGARNHLYRTRFIWSSCTHK